MSKTRPRATKARFAKYLPPVPVPEIAQPCDRQTAEALEKLALGEALDPADYPGIAKSVLPKGALPTNPKARKDIPIVRGCLDYFPVALAAVAELSRIGNDQHNPGQPMHHARGKSTDHADCIVRHLMDRGTIDTDGVRHSTKVAWRALALLQEELEAVGAPLARGAKK
jgi:hypothetical protein